LQFVHSFFYKFRECDVVLKRIGSLLLVREYNKLYWVERVREVVTGTWWSRFQQVFVLEGSAPK